MYQKFERKTKMKLLSIFKNKDNKQTMIQWSSCKHPKTLSFRSGDNIFKTTNSVYFDPLSLNPSSEGEATHLESSWFTNSSSQSTTTASSIENNYSYGYVDESSVERIVREARSERLFFEPGRCNNTSSILELVEAKVITSSFFKESVVLAMESEDPYLDFKNSMEEMVNTHGLKDWESLEELFGWYLKMNGKRNHGYIIGAFVDLLIGHSFPPSSSTCCCSCSEHEHDHPFISASSSFSSHLSPPLSPPPAKSVYQKDVLCTGPMKHRTKDKSCRS